MLFYVCTGTSGWHGYNKFNSTYFRLIDSDTDLGIYEQITQINKPASELPCCTEIRVFQIDPMKISRATIDSNTEIIGDGEDLQFLHATNVEYFLSRKEVMQEITKIYDDIYAMTCSGIISPEICDAIAKVVYYTPETILYKLHKLLELPCSYVADDSVLTYLHDNFNRKPYPKLDMSKVDE